MKIIILYLIVIVFERYKHLFTETPLLNCTWTPKIIVSKKNLFFLFVFDIVFKIQ